MFTDQSRSVKSRIIALHNSPGIPWHIVLLCSLQAGSPTETEISKNKLGLCSFFLLFSSRDQILSCHRRKNKRQNLHCRMHAAMKPHVKCHVRIDEGKKGQCTLFITNFHTFTWTKQAWNPYCISNSICDHGKVADSQNKQMFLRAQLIIPEHFFDARLSSVPAQSDIQGGAHCVMWSAAVLLTSR